MSSTRYQQLTKLNEDDPVNDGEPKTQSHKCSKICIRQCFRGLLMILLYFILSISLTFYQRNLLMALHFPLSIVMYHLVVKWLLSAIVRLMLHLYTGVPRISLPLAVCLQSVGLTGFVSGIDVGFSNWGLELVTVSLYTMTKSTTVIFILAFAIFFGLEKKSWSLVLIVVMISTGLVMFTYKATQFDGLGFTFLILASFASGLRWTFAQMLMQRSKLGLNSPIDMVFHIQPWMLLPLIPFTLGFEGVQLIRYIIALPYNEIWPCIVKISVAAVLAFFMELSEFLVVTYTSSLTLSIAGIFKEMFMLILAVEMVGDELSLINIIGLLICLGGISVHTLHKFLSINNKLHQTLSINFSNISEGIHFSDEVSISFDNRDQSVFKRTNVADSKYQTEFYEPLLPEQGKSLPGNNDKSDSLSDDNDFDANRVIFDIQQRRGS